MNNLILAMSIICFIFSFFMLIADMKKMPAFMGLIMKVLALFGVLLPLIYWLKLNDVI